MLENGISKSIIETTWAIVTDEGKENFDKKRTIQVKTNEHAVDHINSASTSKSSIICDKD